MTVQYLYYRERPIDSIGLSNKNVELIRLKICLVELSGVLLPHKLLYC